MKSRKKLQATPVAVEPRLLGIKATAAYLGVTTWFARSLYWNRTIPTLRLGKRILFDKADLDRYVESQKVSAAA